MTDFIRKYRKYLFIMPYGLRIERRGNVYSYEFACVYLQPPPNWLIGMRHPDRDSLPFWPSGDLNVPRLRKLYSIERET